MTENKPTTNIFAYLLGYKSQLILIFLFSLIYSGLTLAFPQVLARFVDNANTNSEINWTLLWLGFLGFIILSFGVGILQNWFSVKLAEEVALDLRAKLTKKISQQNFDYVSNKGASKLVTIFTSDVEGVKNVVSQGLVTAFSAVVLLFGSAIGLITINFRLAFLVLAILPAIVVLFVVIFTKIGRTFKESQENLEKINQTINESIEGALQVRVLNAVEFEKEKFSVFNLRAKEISLKIINFFSTLIPIVNLFANGGTLLIIYFGGLQVVSGTLSVGNFLAFFTYLSLLITPIFILAFISSFISRAVISFNRITEITDVEILQVNGNNRQELKGSLEFKNVTLKIGQKNLLKNVNFKIESGKKVAIIGPIAAGKTLVFNLISGLMQPSEGQILIDGLEVKEWDKEHLYNQIGLVFQDNILFNSTLKENIWFDRPIENQEKILTTSQLNEVIDGLENGLETRVSERGTNLSGGQKQRVMLARSLAIDPKILLLDDFTARVDVSTEAKIRQKLFENYPSQTLISITQKIEPVKDFDQILLFMEGELLASGTHLELLEKSTEYSQIWDSQQTTQD